VHFEKNLLKQNVTAQTEWSDTRALDWPHEALGLLGWNHCCLGLAHKIRHFVKNGKSGREALVYKQGTQEPQAWLIAQIGRRSDLFGQSSALIHHCPLNDFMLGIMTKRDSETSRGAPTLLEK
jgi:hypothetical protein